MATYQVELTTTVEIEAKSEDEAVEKAYENLRDIDAMYNYDFYAYVNGEPIN